MRTPGIAASWIAALLVPSACGTTPASPAVPVAMRPFVAAAQFLAPGSSSYLFATCDEPDFTSEVEHWLPVVIARSGSDFQKPKDLGAGRCRGVEVRDYGAARVAIPWYEAGEPTTHIAGVPVWLDKGDATNFDREEPLWTAIVEARFHVRTPDRDLLEAALRRTGRLDEIVRPFAPVALLPADAQRVVCLLPRPEDSGYWSRPIPIEPMVVALCATNRLLMFHRQPLPPHFAGADTVVASRTVASRTVEGSTVDEWKWVPPSPAWDQLLFPHFFGLAIFV